MKLYSGTQVYKRTDFMRMINDIKNKLNNLNKLECFDRQVFEL